MLVILEMRPIQFRLEALGWHTHPTQHAPTNDDPTIVVVVSNSAGANASREEEIAFLTMEHVLGVNIELADAGAGEKMPDGRWVTNVAGSSERVAIVEITSPPATELLSEWAQAKRENRSQSESGKLETRFGELAEILNEMLAEEWAQENIAKLLAQAADERHLYLFARGHGEKQGGHYFYRLTDSYPLSGVEPVNDLILPEGLTDVWFRGRSTRDRNDRWGAAEVHVARFQEGVGWHRYLAVVEEQHLPSPSRGIADDPAPIGWRQPKNRVPAASPKRNDV